MILELFFAILIVAVAALCVSPLGALVVLPEGQQRSGKQGGMVWSHNAAGPYTRNRAIPTNPNTDRQIAMRNATRNLTIRWDQTLSEAQREAWRTYALNIPWTNRLGQVINLSGLNHYVRTNALRLQSGIEVRDTAPVIFLLAEAEPLLSCVASEATQDLVIDGHPGADWQLEVGAYQFYFMGLPQNASRQFFGGPWRLIAAAPGAGVSPLPVTAPAAWPFAADQRLWLRSRIMRADGRLSEFAQINFLGVA